MGCDEWAGWGWLNTFFLTVYIYIYSQLNAAAFLEGSVRLFRTGDGHVVPDGWTGPSRSGDSRFRSLLWLFVTCVSPSPRRAGFIKAKATGLGRSSLPDH